MGLGVGAWRGLESRLRLRGSRFRDSRLPARFRVWRIRNPKPQNLNLNPKPKP